MTAISNSLKGNKKIDFPQPQLLTFEDYARLTPYDSGNYELHNGKIIFVESHIYEQQQILGQISTCLYFHVKKYNLGHVFMAPLDTVLTPFDVLQPDILFVSRERLSIIDKQVKGAPDFIVEVLAEGNYTKEMSYKKHIYESTCVREYWFINVIKQSLTQYENIDGEFQQKNIFKAKNTEGVIQSIVIEGFEMKMSDIFQ
jgi:Uma2 family endonuclease